MEESSRPTIVSLVNSLLADLRGLLTKELQLAKHEMQHELSKVLKISIQAGIAAILSLMAVILLCLTLVYVLHSILGLSLWASYGMVAILSTAGAGILGYLVMKLGSTLRLWPFRTIHTLKEDAQWLKEQVLSLKS
ncbi:MAG TPA: phage holin family protein [Nitrospira sp.]|nr:phage holin family protein [Nitrospira sp.]